VLYLAWGRVPVIINAETNIQDISVGRWIAESITRVEARYGIRCNYYMPPDQYGIFYYEYRVHWNKIYSSESQDVISGNCLGPPGLKQDLNSLPSFFYLLGLRLTLSLSFIMIPVICNLSDTRPPHGKFQGK
jgi:hypothetical protein